MGILSIPVRGARVSALFLFTAAAAIAQTAPPDLEQRLAELEKAARSAQMAGDNAWMLTSAALVLMMTGPGLALFYGGLVRRKNVLSTMMQSFILMAVVSVLWAIIGYSLAFDEGNASSAACVISSCTASARRPIPTMPPPFRSTPS